MAPSFQTSRFSTSYGYSRYTRKHYESFEVSVEDFDGGSLDFSIEAESYEEAARKAELMAADMGCYNILNMNIYSI